MQAMMQRVRNTYVPQHDGVEDEHEEDLDSDGELDYTNETPSQFAMDPQWTLRLQGLIREDGHVTTNAEKKYFITIASRFKTNQFFCSIKSHEMAMFWNVEVSKSILNSIPIRTSVNRGDTGDWSFSVDEFTFKTRYQIQKHAELLDAELERQHRAGANEADRRERWARHRNIQEPAPAHPDAPRFSVTALPEFASFQGGQTHFQLVAPEQIPMASTFNTRTDFSDIPAEQNQAIENRRRRAIPCFECGKNRHRSQADPCPFLRFFKYVVDNHVYINRLRGESPIKAAERVWRDMTAQERLNYMNE